jgi:plasmid stability protein
MMPALTLPRVDEDTYARLEERARINRRTIEDEAGAILDHAVREDRAEIARRMAAFRDRLAGRYAGDPLAELRSDRDR